MSRQQLKQLAAPRSAVLRSSLYFNIERRTSALEAVGRTVSLVEQYGGNGGSAGRTVHNKTALGFGQSELAVHSGVESEKNSALRSASPFSTLFVACRSNKKNLSNISQFQFQFSVLLHYLVMVYIIWNPLWTCDGRKKIDKYWIL